MITIQLHDPIPPPVERILASSRIDDMPARVWIADPTIAPIRVACLLNILATLCATPVGARPLSARLFEVFAVKTDRIYGVFDGSIHTVLSALVTSDAQPFYRDAGHPLPIHYQMLADIPKRLDDVVFDASPLVSYRGEGSPSLQLVLTVEGLGRYSIADMDLDECNPLQDVVGFVRHMGELIQDRRNGPTDHFAMRARVARGPAGLFLAYSLVDSGHVA